MNPSSKKQIISIIVPVLNEEDNIPNCYGALSKIADELSSYDFEFIFNDNCSVDESYQLLEQLAKQDKRLVAYRFSRNFGFQKSIYAGLMKAKGEAAIVFDCDLQDPPELLIEFVKKWEEGAKVVYGIRKKREESRWLEWCRKIFYRFINTLSEDHLPPDAGDFRLIDRCILEQLKQVDDYRPYLRGLIAGFGFKQVGIPYERKERAYGKSKFNLRKLFELAVDGVISQSVAPLRFATYTGLVISFITFVGICVYAVKHFFFKAQWPAGFATTTMLILFSLSLNALFLGIIGEYIARIYHQVRKRPLVIFDKSTDNLG
ncbi:MAG: glycosyltransferase family 2 protein [Gammaproteobacteria bacterium]